MKKNLWFKLGLFCAALVLVATCFITGAWAKYTKTVTATDTARVAKFAVNVKNGDTTITDNTSIDIFTTKLDNIYQDGDSKNVNSEKLIAPGSHGSFQIVVENSSEVAVALKLTGSLTFANATSVPVKFYVGTTAPTNDNEYKNLEDLTISNETLAATNGTTVTTHTYTVFWKWLSVSDEADTELGVAGNVTVTANLQLVVEQVLTTK